jgi:hypothetical protein
VTTQSPGARARSRRPAGHGAPSQSRETRPSRSKRTLGGWLWFAAMVGGWLAMFALIALSEPTLDALHDAVQELPLVIELLAWLALFPFLLALTIWTSPWDDSLRLLLVACCALGWTLAFFPWRAADADRHEELT